MRSDERQARRGVGESAIPMPGLLESTRASDFSWGYRGSADTLDTDFSAFYESEFATVQAAVMAYTGSPEAAWDATQEAFSRALVRWRRLSSEPWATGWVMTTALNLVRTRWRRTLGSDGGLDMGPAAGPEASVTARVDLARALSQLPERRRRAVVLFYIGDLPIAAIAELMHVSESAVRSHLTHARKHLRQVLTHPQEDVRTRSDDHE